MIEQAVGVVRIGNSLGVAIVQKNYRQKMLKFSGCIPLAESMEKESIHPDLKNILLDVANREKLSKARVAFGLDASEFLWNSLEMPPVSKDDLLQIVRFELDSHVPIDPDLCVFDLQILDSLEGLTNKVTLFTAYRNKIDNLRDAISQANIGLDAITPVDTALIHYISRRNHQDTDKSLKIILCAIDSMYEVILCQNDRFVSNHIVSIDNPWNDDSGSISEPGQTVLNDNLIDELINNIHLTLLMSNEVMTNIGEILCVGHFSNDIIRELSERMPETPVRRAQMGETVTDRTSFAEIAAICLAFDLFENDETVNLLPAEFRPHRRDIGRMMIGAATGLLLASMILVGANNYWATDLRLLATEARLAAIEHRVNVITDVNVNYSEAQDNRSYFRDKYTEYPSHLAVMLEATQLLPDQDGEELKKVWLEQLDIENKELIIRGNSESPEGIITLLEDSPLFEKVRFDGTVAGTRFTIKANLSKIVGFTETMSDFESGLTNGEELPEETVTSDVQTPIENPEELPSESRIPKDDAVGQSEVESEEPVLQRGPAFPRQTDVNEAEEIEPAEVDYSEPMSIEEQEAISDQTKVEDMEAMKQNLFDFIKDRKESGDFDIENPPVYEEPDPEEAAANFIEFLKAVADSEQEEE